ncbi:MAG: tetratricopeptide repeat protein [Planctomycetes bacterium]|nr:tetratricopeptide repeat protein [Planctomycetota bacterium]
MSYLLESLGRGLLGQMLDAFERQFPESDDDVDQLETQRRYSTTSVDLGMRTGAAQLRACRISAARRTFEELRRRPESKDAAAIGLACAFDELGAEDDAIAMLESARAGRTDDPAISFSIGMCHERANRPVEARQAYSQAIDLCPRLRNAHERLAAMAVSRGDWREAEDCYAALARMEPGDMDILLTLATIRLAGGRTEAAITTFQDALLVEPEATEDALDEVEAMATEGALSRAIGTLEKLVAKFPGVGEFHVHLGDLYVRAGNDDRAVAQYQSALQVHPSFLEATVKLGTQQLRIGDFQQAARTFNRAAELSDRLLLAFVGLGVAQAAADRPIEAAATFDLAVGLAPNSTLLMAESARLHLKAHRRRTGQWNAPIETDSSDLPNQADTDGLLQDAIDRTEKLICAGPLRADAHYRHALLLQHAGDTDRALSAMQRAVNIAPSFAKAQIKLGILFHQAGRTAEALGLFKRGIDATQDSVDSHYQLALLFANRNQFELAFERMTGEVDSERDLGAIRSGLSLALQGVGMVDREGSAWNALNELAMQGGFFPADRFTGAGLN